MPWLFAVDALLVALHAVLGGSDAWNLDREHNLPTWYAGAKLGWIGIAALDAYVREGALLSHPFPPRALWALAGAFFLYLSLDETTVIHEGLFREELRDLFPADSLWITLLPWQLVFGPLLFGAALGLLALFASRFAGSARLQRPAIAGIACWSGAVLTEALAKPLFMVHGVYAAGVAIEEGLELAGATALLLAFSRYPAELESGRVELVDLRLERRRFVRAVAAFTLAIVVGAAIVVVVSLRHSAWLHRHAAGRLTARGQHERAIVAYREALAIAPNDAGALVGIARAEARLDRFAAAIAAYDRALGLRADDARSWNGRGVALHELGRFAEAEQSYRRAIELRPRYARAIANLGLALERQGRMEEAKTEYRRALDAEPGQELAAARLARLERKP